MKNKLLIFGFGYTAKAICKLVQQLGWAVIATSRQPKINFNNNQSNFKLIDFNYTAVKQALGSTSHILVSAPPDQENKDPVLKEFRSLIANYAPNLKWIGYLSSTGVYGDHQGAWVDESTPVKLGTSSLNARFQAENAWSSLGNDLMANDQKIVTQIFRLAGIYGPGKNILSNLQNGIAKNIYKEGQVFSRIHVDDIASILVSLMLTSVINPALTSRHNEIYNLCDDLATSTNELINYAARLLNLPVPPIIDLNDHQLSSRLIEFYSNNKRIKNNKIKTTLAINLIYPSYREGLNAIYAKNEY